MEEVKRAIVQIIDRTKGITQVALARLSNVQRTQINSYLRQGGTLSLNSRVRLAKALLVELDRVSKQTGIDLRKEFEEAISVLLGFLSQQVSGKLPIEAFFTSANENLKKKGEKRIAREDLGKLWPKLEKKFRVKIPVPNWYDNVIKTQVSLPGESMISLSWSQEYGLKIIIDQQDLGALLIILMEEIPGATWRINHSSERIVVKEI